jgi:hypothetical protein
MEFIFVKQRDGKLYDNNNIKFLSNKSLFFDFQNIPRKKRFNKTFKMSQTTLSKLLQQNTKKHLKKFYSNTQN